MSNEVTVRVSLQIRKGELDYRSYPTQFQADASVGEGPTPGLVLATTAGVSVDLTELSTPGFCWMQNLDATNYVTYGIWDPENSTFFPIGELLPGEFVMLRLARDIEEEYGTGTGTTGANTNRLRLKADTASCHVRVEAFEK